MSPVLISRPCTLIDTLDISNGNLEFVAAPALAPPEVTVDPILMEQYNQELAQAAAAPLPEEDDDF